MKMYAIKRVLWLLSFTALANSLKFSIDSAAKPVFIVDEKFISTTTDSWNIVDKLQHFNVTDSRLEKLMKHLSPMYWRIGGTEADNVRFSLDENSKEDGILKGSEWLKFYEFSKKAGVRLLFCLNSLLRKKDGSWDSENAEQMIKFSQENGIETDWQLGNEPDLYQALFKKQVSASQLASDYKTLRAILDKYGYKSSLLVGPDMFDVGGNPSNQQYLSKFLEGGASAIEAVTWHQYYFAGDVAKESMFLDPATFNYLEQRTNVVNNIVAKRKLVWLGETSSAYKKGAPEKSDRFLATFLWLDKLGLGAKLGINLVIRQTFQGYNYALVSNSSVPNPDWWVSVYYKRLVGQSVLSTKSDAAANSKVRLYAHCATRNSVWGSSAVVVFGVNIGNEAANFDLEEMKSGNKVYFFEFTSDSTLYSQSIRLNDQTLFLTEDLELPNVQPRILEKTKSYTMAPYSLGFWVFPDTNVTACN